MAVLGNAYGILKQVSAFRYLNKERLTLSGAHSAATIATGALMCIASAEDGEIRYDINTNGTPTSPAFIAENNSQIIYLTGVTSLGFYGAATTYAIIIYYG